MKKRNLLPLLVLSCLLMSCGGGEVSASISSSINESTSSINELDAAKAEATSFIDSINVDDYINQEKADIEYLIEGLRNLINNASIAEQIYVALTSIREYIETAKTKADYEYEEALEKEKVFNKRKEELLKKAGLERANRFRKQEQDAIKAIGNELIEEINKATTIEELNAISFTEFDNLVNGSTTNAAYMVKEWYNFHLNSKWDLVNEHTSNWPYQESTFKTNGLGVDDVGYQITSNKYKGELEVLLSCHNTVTSSENFGFLIGNMNPTGNGFDGYLVNYAYTTSHQYLQIWQFVNANAPENATVYQYIGGWEYEKSYNTKLYEDDIRVFYDGEYIKLYRDAEYQEKGELAQCCITSLMYNNRYAIDPDVNEYSVGFFNWDGANITAPRILEVKEFITEEVIDSRDTLSFFATRVINEVDLSLYDTEEQTLINQKGVELLEFIQSSNSYDDSFNKISEFKDFVASTKTHEQKELDAYPDISVEILDNIYSGDPTKYSASNWDLVNEHALNWSHEKGSHIVITDGKDGFCMDAAIHTNFTVKFKVTNTQPENPYNFSMPGSALIIGGNISGNYFTGVEVVLSQNWGFQLHNSMAGSHKDPACYGDQFMGGIERNSEGSIYRLTFQNGILKVYLVNPNNGLETQLSGVNAGFGACSEWNLGNLSGHFGIMDWDLRSTTYEIIEFRDL